MFAFCVISPGRRLRKVSIPVISVALSAMPNWWPWIVQAVLNSVMPTLSVHRRGLSKTARNTSECQDRVLGLLASTSLRRSTARRAPSNRIRTLRGAGALSPSIPSSLSDKVGFPEPLIFLLPAECAPLPSRVNHVSGRTISAMSDMMPWKRPGRVTSALR